MGSHWCVYYTAARLDEDIARLRVEEGESYIRFSFMNQAVLLNYPPIVPSLIIRMVGLCFHLVWSPGRYASSGNE